MAADSATTPKWPKLTTTVAQPHTLETTPATVFTQSFYPIENQALLFSARNYPQLLWVNREES